MTLRAGWQLTPIHFNVMKREKKEEKDREGKERGGGRENRKKVKRKKMAKHRCEGQSILDEENHRIGTGL